MKNVLKKIIIFTSIFLIPITSVYAEAGFSGSGVVQKTSGGGGGKSKSGLTLGKAVMLKFTLIKAEGDEIIPLSRAYMINFNSSTLTKAFKGKEKNNICDYFNGSLSSYENCIVGDLTEDGYKLSEIQLTETAKKTGNLNDQGLMFSNIGKILPDGSYLTFNVNNLRIAVMGYSTNKITPEYENIVLYMLKLGEVTEETELDKIDDIDKYRMLIEPVYYLKKDDNHYMFATTKAIANMANKNYPKNNPAYGVYADQLAYNLYADEQFGKINNPFLYHNGGYNSSNPWENIADGYNGIGYAMVRLKYDDTPYCKIEKDENGNFIYYDSGGIPYENDAGGYNFGYFIKEGVCGCKKLETSPYRDEILNPDVYPEIREIYDRDCDSKICQYEKRGGTYTFYGNDGNKVGSYKDFIDSCGCGNVNVLSLRSSVSKFSNTYNNKCSNPDDDEGLENNLNDCNDTEYKTSTLITAADGKVENIIDTEDEDYEMNYHFKRKIANDNKYCTVTCDEHININNMVGKYKVMAGQYFKFSEYPQIIAKKSCSVETKYRDWNSDYEDALEDLKIKYNIYARKYASVYESPESIGDCNCDENDNCDTKYKYYYQEYKVTQDKVTGEPKIEPNSRLSSGTYCQESDESDSTIKKAKNAFEKARADLKALFDKLNECNTFLSEDVNPYDFYDFQLEFQFLYDQRYANGNFYTNSRPNLFNHSIRPNSLDDSGFIKFDNKDEDAITETTESKYYDRPDSCNYSIMEINGRETIGDGTASVDTEYNNDFGDYCTNTAILNRTVEYTYNSSPAVYKKVNAYDYEISEATGDEITNKKANNPNQIYLGNVYDTDVTSIARTNKNYYIFTKLGDAESERDRQALSPSASSLPAENGQIYNYIKDSTRCTGSSNCKLERYCDYKVENEIFKTDEPDDPEPENPSDPTAIYNVVFRIVSPSIIDPNNRLIHGDYANTVGFKNWVNSKGDAVKREIETTDTFNPENLEYEFIIDGGVIKKIRDYNAENKYNDFNLKCEDGLECISDFIKDYETNYGKATIRAGSNIWRYLEYDETAENKYSIKTYARGEYASTKGKSYDEIVVGDEELHP